jgi:hypothetical protein
MKAEIIVKYVIEFTYGQCDRFCIGITPCSGEHWACTIFRTSLTGKYPSRCPACIEATTNQFARTGEMVDLSITKEKE